MISLLYITFPNEMVATELTNHLITNGLAACRNIFPIQSGYLWQSNFCNDHEIVAIVKTMPSYVLKIEEYILAHHPYEVPCIIRWEAVANADYEAWIQSCLKPII